MNSKIPISIRLSPEKRLLYEAEAMRRKLNLSAYLREWLEKNEVLSHGSQNLQDSLKSNSLPSSSEEGILLEILLLLRTLTSPEKRNMVQSELKRLNIPVWKGGSSSEETKYAT